MTFSDHLRPSSLISDILYLISDSISDIAGVSSCFHESDPFTLRKGKRDGSKNDPKLNMYATLTIQEI